MGKTVSVLGFAGSTRENSFNVKLMLAIQKLMPADVELKLAEDYLEQATNFDIYRSSGAAMKGLEKIKQQVEKADAVIFSTPQYNYTMPVVIRNTVEMLAQTPETNVWKGKVGAVVGASMDSLGPESAVKKLNDKLKALEMRLVEDPVVILTKIQEEFNEKGELVHEGTIKKLKELVAAVVKLARG